jgi:hypothetical protein
MKATLLTIQQHGCCGAHLGSIVESGGQMLSRMRLPHMMLMKYVISSPAAAAAAAAAAAH